MPLDIDRIHELMAGRTQAEIAAAAGMMQPSLARVLSGRFDPRLSTVERIAKALGCAPAKIIASVKDARG